MQPAHCCLVLAVSFGITGKDYVLFASDTSAARSIVKMKSTEDKQKVVGKHLCMACKSSASLPEGGSSWSPRHLVPQADDSCSVRARDQTLANRETLSNSQNTLSATSVSTRSGEFRSVLDDGLAHGVLTSLSRGQQPRSAATSFGRVVGPNTVGAIAPFAKTLLGQSPPRRVRSHIVDSFAVLDRLPRHAR